MSRQQTVTLTVVPLESAILVEARSSVGPIVFGSATVTGRFHGTLDGDALVLERLPEASLALPVASLTSGNKLWDSEVRSRLNERRYPTITAELRGTEGLGGGRYSVLGDVTIHGKSQTQTGAMALDVHVDAESSDVAVVVSGTQLIDVRDFEIELPRLFMLQIYPEVTVRYRVRAVSTNDLED